MMISRYTVFVSIPKITARILSIFTTRKIEHIVPGIIEDQIAPDIVHFHNLIGLSVGTP